MKRYQFKVAALIALSQTLVACDLDDLFSGSDKKVKFDELAKMEARVGHLTLGNADKVKHILKNGMAFSPNGGDCFDVCAVNFTTAADAESGDSASRDDNYSQTTTQEDGIDESDRVKYDGDFVYLASNKMYWYNTSNDESQRAHVRILKRNGDDSLTTQARLELSENVHNIASLYVHDDNLLSIATVFSTENDDNGQNTNSDLAIWPNYPRAFEMQFADVSDKSQVESHTTFKIDGYPVTSRRIGNKVYLLSRYNDYPHYYISDDSPRVAQQQYEALLDDDTVQLFPNITINGESKPLVDADSCYIPADADYTDSHNEISVLSVFDLTAPEQYRAICVVMPVDGLYASSDGIYLYDAHHEFLADINQYQSKTTLHQFTYNASDVTYNASGVISGQLGWSNAHLRMSEYQGDLRIVTTDNMWGEQGPEHKLYILRPNNGNLDVVATLPNDESPAKIGKPNEDIYAVRYFGDKAYIVTFERTDPLYVLDLSDVNKPKITGELEIPGFSSYLQPLNENFVLGIGQEVDPNRGTAEADPNFVSGAKIELYDVSNPQNPVVAGKLVYPNSHSVAEYDYHALTMLKTSDEQYRFAFATSSWAQAEQDDGSTTWQYTNQMQLVSVSLAQGGEVSQVGALEAATDYYGIWGDRAIIHDNLIYYIRHNSIWQSYWDNSSVLNGPY